MLSKDIDVPKLDVGQITIVQKFLGISLGALGTNRCRVVTNIAGIEKPFRFAGLIGLVVISLLAAACSESTTYSESTDTTETTDELDSDEPVTADPVADTDPGPDADSDPYSEENVEELPFEETDPASECNWEYVGESLTGNVGNELPSGTVQVVLFYAGDEESEPNLTIKMNGSDLVVGGEAAGGPLPASSEQIETREYRTTGCETISGFEVDGIVPNGDVYGLAYGVLFKSPTGQYSMFKSQNNNASVAGIFVGMPPLGMGDQIFAARTPQLKDAGRVSARAIIYGAALSDNGRS